MIGEPSYAGEEPTIYPEEERVGEELLQRWIAELLRPLLEAWLNTREQCLVGADQFIYYEQYNAHKRYAPDIYVLPGVPPTTRVRSWKTWQTGIAPSFALEVVSSDWEKDYVEAAERCSEAGIAELIVFDPGFADRPGGAGARWQVFGGPRGSVHLVERTDALAVRSRVLDVWFHAVGLGDAQRVRIATADDPATLIPTAEEAERAGKETERAEKEAALAKIRELEARLARAERRRPDDDDR